MKIVWSNGAKKAFSRIDERYQRRIEVKLAELDDRSAPRPDIKKISAKENHFRLRVGDTEQRPQGVDPAQRIDHALMQEVAPRQYAQRRCQQVSRQ